MPNFQDTSPATNFAAGLNSGLGLVAGVENLRASEVNRRNTESVIRSRDVETNFAQLTQGLGIVERMDALKTAAINRRKVELEMEHMPRRLAVELETAEVVRRAEHLKLDNLIQFGAEKALAELETANLAMGIERAKTQVQQAELKRAELAATHEAEFMSAAPEFLSVDTMNPAAAYLSAVKLKRTFSDKLPNPHFGKAISDLRASAMDAKRSEYVPYLDSDGVRQYKPVERRFGDAVALARGNFEAGANMALDVFGVDRATFTQMMEEYSAEGGRPFQAPSNETAAEGIRRRTEELRKGKPLAPGAAPLSEEAAVKFYGSERVGQMKQEAARKVELGAAKGRAAVAQSVAKDPATLVARVSKAQELSDGEGERVADDLKLFTELVRKGKTEAEAKEEIRNRVYRLRGQSIANPKIQAQAEADVARRLSLLDAALAE